MPVDAPALPFAAKTGSLKLLKLGTVSLDGAKIKANASRHKALSYGHLQKVEAQLREQVQRLLAKAEAADRTRLPGGLDVPAEIAKREGAFEADAGCTRYDRRN